MIKVVLLLLLLIVVVPYNNANSYDSTTIMSTTSNIFSYIYNFVTLTIFNRLDNTDNNRQLRDIPINEAEEMIVKEYAFTNSIQIFIVPDRVSSIRFELRGGSGGSDTEYNIVQSGEVLGSFAGNVVGLMSVVPGTTYYIYIGGEGTNRTSFGDTNLNGGFNGGGASGRTQGAAGGGASDIRMSLDHLSINDTRIAVAGGGGGSAVACGQLSTGGSGLGDSASTITCEGTHDPATGGTLQLGGNYAYFPRDNCQGTQGSRGFGGNACWLLGGGGGGGYFGGGGGASGGGGGGSSYADPILTRNVSFSMASTRGNGYLRITYRAPKPTKPTTKPTKRSPSKPTKPTKPTTKPTKRRSPSKHYVYRTHSPSRKPTNSI